MFERAQPGGAQLQPQWAAFIAHGRALLLLAIGVRLPPVRRPLRRPAPLTLQPPRFHCRCDCWRLSRQRRSLPRRRHLRLLRLLRLILLLAVAAPLLTLPLLLCWMPLHYRLPLLLLLLPPLLLLQLQLLLLLQAPR